MLSRAPNTIAAYYLPEEQDPMLRPYVKEFMLDDKEFDQHMADVLELETTYQHIVGQPPPEGTRFTFPISEYIIQDAGIQRTLDEISSIKPPSKMAYIYKLISRFLQQPS
jgi:hypothetical protein